MPPQNQTRGNNSGLRLFPVGGFTGQGSTWGPSRAEPSRWGACPGARACAAPRPGAGPAPCSAEPARLCPSCPPGKLHAPQRASPPRLPLRGGGGGGRGLRSAAPPREGRQNKTDPGDTAKHDGTPWGGHSPHAQHLGGRGQGTGRTLPRHTAPAKGGWCEGCVKSSRSRPPLTCADRQPGPRNPQAAVFIYNNV